MPVITKTELKGNPPREDTVETAQPATPVLGHGAVSHGISAAAARELGENAVKDGALERAERHVSGFSPMPKASDQPKRITVDRDGKVIDASAATEGATVLVGAEAEAYEAKHGGSKAADKSADKGRKRKAATKGRTTRASASSSRKAGSARRR